MRPDKILSRTLPLDDDNYFEILGKGDSVSMRSGLVTLAPGKDVGEHSTENYEELLIILDGDGQLEAGGARIEIHKGQVAYNPPQTMHNVKNTGKSPLKYIYVVALVKSGN